MHGRPGPQGFHRGLRAQQILDLHLKERNAENDDFTQEKLEKEAQQQQEKWRIS